MKTLFVIALIVFTYWRLPNAFFQQDEWQTLSFMTYYHSKGFPGIIESFLPVDALSHVNPLATVFAWYEYVFYGTHFPFYAWQSIVLHGINTLLLYWFVFSWFRKKNIASVAAIFFAVNSIPHQAVTWVAAANSYEVPTAFILLSLIFFQKEKFFSSFLMLFVSLLFHENGIFLFIFYPLVLLFNKHAAWKRFIPIFLGTIALFIVVRAPFFFGLTSKVPSVTDISKSPLAVYPYRLLSIGAKSFAGSVVPEKTLIAVSEAVVRLAYPQFITADGMPNPYIVQSIVFDLVSYALTVLIVCFALLFIRLTRDKKIAEGARWALLFVPASLLPYGFVLGKAGYASILDPKFYYVASIGINTLIGLVMRGKKFAVYAFFVLFLVFHIYSTKTYLMNLQAISSTRKTLLTTIQSAYKQLPKKVIFLTESDTTYYGMPDNEKILPVQIGFGKMLMIWYQKTEQFPGCLYEGQFLIQLLEQGYRECAGRGFGYFRDFNKLAQAVKDNNISQESVIAYSWDRKRNTFANITDSIREMLAEEVQ